jgi:hypothetical protein
MISVLQRQPPRLQIRRAKNGGRLSTSPGVPVNIFWGEATGFVKRSLATSRKKQQSRAEEKTWMAFSDAAQKTSKSVYYG